MKNQQGMGVYMPKKENWVCIDTIRTPSTTISRRGIIKTWICTKKTHPGFMETQMAADMFHPGG